MDLREESFILKDYINYALPLPGLSVEKTSECLINCGKKAGSKWLLFRVILIADSKTNF